MRGLPAKMTDDDGGCGVSGWAEREHVVRI